MTRGHPDAPPTWFRLCEESWAEIREAYRNGATARDLAARWRVSPTSIYRHACAGGWTKKASADATARAHAAQIGAEEAADEAGLTQAPPEPVAPTASAMRQRALRDMSRALAAGRYGDAQTLARFLQSLGQLALEDEDAEERGDDDEARGSSAGDGAAINYLAARLAEVRAETLWPRIHRLAEELLSDRISPPAVFSRAFLRWRAEHLGPAQAEADRQDWMQSPHYGAIYDEDGRVREGWGRTTDFLQKPEGADAFEARLRAAHAQVTSEDEPPAP